MRALVLLAVLAGCGTAVTVYHRTGPRRVEVTKQASAPQPFALAERTASGDVAIRIKQASRTTIRRIVHHNAVAVRYGHSHSVWNEVTETFTGLLMLPLPGAFWGIGDRIDGQDTPDRKTVRHRKVLLALLDPTTSVFTNNITTDPIVPQQIFSDPPTVREYEIRLPAPNVPVTYRLLDVDGHEVAAGSGTTDVHGELVAPAATARAIAVEVALAGKPMVVPITEQVATEEPPVETVHAPAAIGPALADPAWTKFRHRSDRLPRVTLAFDLVSLFPPSGARGVVEVRITRKMAAMVLGGYAQTDYELTSGETVYGSGPQVGGQFRYYALGNFAQGLHVDVEASYTQFDVSFLSGKRIMETIGTYAGYKYMFEFGATIDLAAGFILYQDDDSLGGNALSDFLFYGHMNVGWSF